MQTYKEQSAWKENLTERHPFTANNWYNQALGTLAHFPNEPTFVALTGSNTETQDIFSARSVPGFPASMQWTAVVNIQAPAVAVHSISYRVRRDIRPTLELIKANYERRNREELETAWLQENRQRFAGEWIALQGNRLLAHSHIAREVFDVARTMRPRPLVMQIEQADVPFAGW